MFLIQAIDDSFYIDTVRIIEKTFGFLFYRIILSIPDAKKYFIKLSKEAVKTFILFI